MSEKKSLTLIVPENIAMVDLIGHHDVFLKCLETKYSSRISVRGNEVTAVGDKSEVEEIELVITELIDILSLGRTLNEQMIEQTVQLMRSKERSSTVFGDLILTHRGKVIGPKTKGQKTYIDMIRNNTITFAIGPAGTGKTYLAMAMAISFLKEKKIGRLILTRPAVEAGERLGFLPGGVFEKVDPYLRPLFDALYDMMDPEELQRYMERNIIEVAPLAYMRGRTLNDSFIILDEAQNTSPEQMKMFLTRLGFGSRIIATGDTTQIDLPKNAESGLVIIEEILKDISGISFIHMTAQDVVRHKLVQDIVEAYKVHEDTKQKNTRQIS